MAMIIQHNMLSINANRQLDIVSGSLAKSTEKLSSGYRINRAADDAAGLAISEKMRSQIRGLSQASTNAADGISLIQTAEGALNESHSILQRMRQLAVQAANGTETDEDRGNLQDEIEQLQDELDRIAETTEFNTMKLLDGSFDGVSSTLTGAGPKYGQYDGTLGAFITSEVSGITITTTTTATVGGESAIWDATGKNLTFHLANHRTYTQADIDFLIKNALQEDSTATNAPAEITVKFATGVFTASGETSKTTVPTVAGTKASTKAGILSGTVGGNNGASSGPVEPTVISSIPGATVELKVVGPQGISGWGNATLNGNTVTLELLCQVYNQAEIDAIMQTATNNISLKLPYGSYTPTVNTTFTPRNSASGNIGNSAAGVNGLFVGADTINLTSDKYGQDYNIDIKLTFDAEEGKESVSLTTAPSYHMSSASSLSDVVNTRAGYTLSLMTGKEYTSTDIENLLAEAGLAISVELSGAAAPGTDEPNTLFITDSSYSTVLSLAGGTGLGDDDAFLTQNYYDSVASTGGIRLQIGANEGQTLHFNIGNMSADALGVNSQNVRVDQQGQATRAITTIDRAIETVSKQRATLGAVQNRLEHTIANLDTSAENLQTAESRIRDVDMATEIVEYSKNNILSQASQSMLTQANQSTQGVLSLLQG